MPVLLLAIVSQRVSGDAPMGKWDLDGDGHLNSTEFSEALDNHGHDHTPGEATRAFEKHDGDIDGKLTLHQAKAALSHEGEGEFQRKVDRYLWPAGLLACPLLFATAGYHTSRIIIYDDFSQLTMNIALWSVLATIGLQLSFINGWTIVVDLAGFVTILWIIFVLPMILWREFNGSKRKTD